MKPFRWTIARREQLGTRVDLTSPRNLNRNGFLSELRATAARVLAMSNGADLAFLGRTPENFFDYLSGILGDIADAPNLHLIQFSLRWTGEGGVDALPPHKLKAFFDYLAEEGVDAPHLQSSARPLALVDFIADGGTMRNFVSLLHLNAQRTGADWNVVQRRLRIIGLRVRTHNSPNTWRWQQHQDWLGLIPNTAIKNVSASTHLLYHMANSQPKVTWPFHPGRWDREQMGAGDMTAQQQDALDLSARLYDLGKSKSERGELARLMARSPFMRQPATRQLVLRLKGQ